MMDVSKHRARDATRTFVDPAQGVALGFGYTATFGLDPCRPSWLENEDLVVAVDGQVDPGTVPIQTDRAASPVGHTIAYRFHQDEPSFPAGLDGVFSFVLWDRHTSRLYLSSDPIGHRYVYYYWEPDRRVLVFSSELKGVLAHLAVPRSLEPDAVVAYMGLGVVPPPMSFVKDVSKLLPAECLVFEGSGVEARRFLQVEIEGGPDDEGYWVPRVRQEFLAALERSAGGASKVGVYFSGGLDSSNVLAGLKVLGAPKAEAFTLVYNGHSDDYDIAWAREVAGKLGIAHHIVRVDVEAEITPGVVATALDQMDEPMLSTLRSFNEVFLSRATLGRGLTTALNGSTPSFGLSRVRRMIERAGYTTAEELFLGFMVRYHFSLEEMEHATGRKPDPDVLHRLSYVNEALCSGLDDLQRLILSARLGVNTLRDTLFFEQMPPLFGQEQRSPFRDTKLVTLQLSVPPRLRGMESAEYEKRLWKRAFEDLLPAGLSEREKRAYPAAPKPAWLKAILLPRLRVLVEDGILRPGYLEWLGTKLDKGRRGEFESWHWFWFAWWYVRTIRQEDPLDGMSA
jgi:asparagine synthetase B (glutamine-hydrolysing)